MHVHRWENLANFLCWWEADNWKIRGYCQITIILIHPVNMLLNSQVQGQGNIFFLIKLSLFHLKSDIFLLFSQPEADFSNCSAGAEQI